MRELTSFERVWCQEGKVQLSWSLRALCGGVWPSSDHTGREFRVGTPEHTRAGTPLANGLFGTLWSIKGDLDHFANAFHLNHRGAATPCPYCPANTDEHSDTAWNSLKANSPWKQLEHTAEEWHLLNPEPQPLAKLPHVSVMNVEVESSTSGRLPTSFAASCGCFASRCCQVALTPT